MKNNNAIFNTIDNGIIILDENLNVLAWNYWLEIRTKIKSENIIGKNICDEFTYINEKKLKRKVKSVLVTNNPSYYSVDPHQYLIDIKINSIMNITYKSMQQDITIVPYDKNEKKVCLYIYDKTALCEINYKLEQLNMELKEISTKDPLTKVYNRRYFADFSERMLSIANRNEQDICLISLDIDWFKKINDKYGHSVGDIVLIELSKVLLENVRQSDIVARFGGEEFVLFIYNSTLENTKKIADTIRVKIEQMSIETELGELKTTASLGVSQYIEIKDKKNMKTLLKRADDALYKAKQSGRNQVVVN
jgi:diguanylate cyclase (GGDEF)-like protein